MSDNFIYRRPRRYLRILWLVFFIAGLVGSWDFFFTGEWKFIALFGWIFLSLAGIYVLFLWPKAGLRLEHQVIREWHMNLAVFIIAISIMTELSVFAVQFSRIFDQFAIGIFAINILTGVVLGLLARRLDLIEKKETK